MPSAEATSVIRVRLVNHQSRHVSFCLEPWGEVYPMAAGTVFVVVARGPDGDTLEIEAEEDRLTVYGWPGSVVQVFEGESEIGPGLAGRPPVPSSV